MVKILVILIIMGFIFGLILPTKEIRGVLRYSCLYFSVALSLGIIFSLRNSDPHKTTSEIIILVILGIAIVVSLIFLFLTFVDLIQGPKEERVCIVKTFKFRNKGSRIIPFNIYYVYFQSDNGAKNIVASISKEGYLYIKKELKNSPQMLVKVKYYPRSKVVHSFCHL